MNLSHITTLVFDLDGTLLDTLEDLTSAVNYALVLHKLPACSKSEIRSYLGSGYAKLIEQALKGEDEIKLRETVLTDFKAYYEKNNLVCTKPYDGVIEMLSALKTKGYKMALVSNKGNDAVQDLVTRFFSDYFDVAIGEREGIKRKPAPDAVWLALEDMRSTKSESLYIGDSEIDYQTAINASLQPINCLWGFRDKDFLENYGVTCFIEKPKDLLALL